MLALQQAVHKIELDEVAYVRADTDNDDIVSAKDALEMLQIACGLKAKRLLEKYFREHEGILE